MKMKKILAIATLSALLLTAGGVVSVAKDERESSQERSAACQEKADCGVLSRMLDLLLEEAKERILGLSPKDLLCEGFCPEPTSCPEEPSLSEPSKEDLPEEEQPSTPKPPVSVEPPADDLPASDIPAKDDPPADLPLEQPSVVLPPEEDREEPILPPETENEEPALPSKEQQEPIFPSAGQNDAVLAYEQEVVHLVNEERTKRGLAPLTYSAELSDGAREKSADMQKMGYFSHQSPTYGSPFDQMKARGISYRSAGENIAMGYATPEAVVNAWMNSEGHRANILSERFTEIGVGYVAKGNYCTQWFKG